MDAGSEAAKKFANDLNDFEISLGLRSGSLNEIDAQKLRIKLPDEAIASGFNVNSIIEQFGSSDALLGWAQGALDAGELPDIGKALGFAEVGDFQTALFGLADVMDAGSEATKKFDNQFSDFSISLSQRLGDITSIETDKLRISLPDELLESGINVDSIIQQAGSSENLLRWVKGLEESGELINLASAWGFEGTEEFKTALFGVADVMDASSEATEKFTKDFDNFTVALGKRLGNISAIDEIKLPEGLNAQTIIDQFGSSDALLGWAQSELDAGNLPDIGKALGFAEVGDFQTALFSLADVMDDSTAATEKFDNQFDNFSNSLKERTGTLSSQEAALLKIKLPEGLNTTSILEQFDSSEALLSWAESLMDSGKLVDKATALGFESVDEFSDALFGMASVLDDNAEKMLKTIEYDQSIQSQIQDLKIKGSDAELAQLQTAHEKEVAAAQKINGDITAANELFYLKRLEITDKYNEKIIDSYIASYEQLANSLSKLGKDLESDILNLQGDDAKKAARQNEIVEITGSLSQFNITDLLGEINPEAGKEGNVAATQMAIDSLDRLRQLSLEQVQDDIDSKKTLWKLESDLHDKRKTSFADEAAFIISTVTNLGGVSDSIKNDKAQIANESKQMWIEDKVNNLNTSFQETFDIMSTSILEMDDHARSVAKILGSIEDGKLLKTQQLFANNINTYNADLQTHRSAISGLLAEQEGFEREIAGLEFLSTEQQLKQLDIEKRLAQETKTFQENQESLVANADEYRASLLTARDAQKEAAQQSLDIQITAIETAHDLQIAEIERVSQVRVDTLNKEQELAVELKSSIESTRASLRNNIDQLRGTLNQPGTSTSEKLASIQITNLDSMLNKARLNLNPNDIKNLMANGSTEQQSVDFLSTQALTTQFENYQTLIMQSLDEQIDKTNEQFEKQKESIDAQIKFQATLLDFTKEMANVATDFRLDKELSTLSSFEQYQETKSLLMNTKAQAEAGDQDAMTALPDLMRSLLQISRERNASGEKYQADFEMVQRMSTGLSTSSQAKADTIKQELEALPLDQTQTAVNVLAIQELQRTALQKLETADFHLNQLATQPIATPLPDWQLQQELDKLEANKIESLAAAERHKIEFITSAQVNSDALILELQTNLGTKLSQLDFALLGVTTQLQAEADFFQIQSEKPFGNETWAQEIKAMEASNIALLTQMGNYILRLDTSLRTSLNSHVLQLSNNLSTAMQVNVGERLSQTLNANNLNSLFTLNAGFGGMQNTMLVQNSGLIGVQSAIQGLSSSLTAQRAYTPPARSYNSVSGSQRHGKSDSGGSSNMCWDQSERAYTSCNHFKKYATGTSYVPETGPAVLHQGEMVFDRELSDMLRDYGIPIQPPQVQIVPVPIIVQPQNTELQKQNEKLDQQNQILFALLEQQKKLFEKQNNVIATTSTKVERAIKAPKAAR